MNQYLISQSKVRLHKTTFKCALSVIHTIHHDVEFDSSCMSAYLMGQPRP